MPNLIIDLDVDRVDLVDEGANSAAFIELYKRKEHGEPMTVEDVISKLKPEHAELITDAINKAKEEVSAANDELAKAKAECEKACTERDEAKAECEKACAERDAAMEEKEEQKASGTSFDEAETLKSMPEAAKEYVAKLKAQKEAAEAEVRKAKEAEVTAEAVAKAATLKAIPVEQEKLVDILKGASVELVDLLTSVNAAIEGTVLDEVGKSRTNDQNSLDAWDKIEAKAVEVAKRDSVTKQKAIATVINENPELYKEYLKGGAN